MLNPFKISPIFEWNYTSKAPINVNQGGTSSGKTYSILQVLLLKAAERPGVTVTVAGQDMPNLKVGAIRDFQTILNSNEFFSSFIASVNMTDKLWTLHNGSRIEFKSYDNEQDARNGKREYLFVNEANGIPYEIFYQLNIRATIQTFIDYNPSAPFWVHHKLIGREDVQLFISHFEHNPFIKPEIKRKILNLKETDPEKWRVYGRGLTGKTEGVIFNNVDWITKLPAHVKRVCYGMDFGFTNDPTTLIKCGTADGELYAERLIYATEMTTKNISDALKELGLNSKDTIFADSADPKTIRELRNLGWHVLPAKKGADSIRHGIDEIKKFKKLNIVNCEYWKDEQLSYAWAKDRRTGRPTNKPIDSYNHLWDALRYGIQGITKRKRKGATYS